MRASDRMISESIGIDPDRFEKLAEIRVQQVKNPKDALENIPWLAAEIEPSEENKRKNILKILSKFSDDYPEHVLPVTTKLFNQLRGDIDRETEKYIFKTLNNLVEIQPGLAQDHVDVIEPYILNQDSNYRRYATYLLINLSKKDHDAALPVVEKLAEVGDPELLDVNTLGVVGRTTKNHPKTGKKFTTAIIELVETSEGKKRANALGVLADISDHYTQDLAEYSDRWIKYLDHDDSNTRFNSVYILRQLAIKDATLAEPGEEKFQELLDDDFKYTRLNACIALAEIESKDSLNKIKDMAEMDESREVRKVARKAVRKIEGGSQFKL